MRMRKKQSTYFEGKKVILALLLTCIFAIGSGFSANAANSQVTDQAGLLSQSEIEEIESQIEKMEEKTGWDVMAVTTNDAEGMDATYYAEKWLDSHMVGNDGIIWLIDMENRELVVSGTGEPKDFLTDKRKKSILDSAYEKISNKDYAKTFMVMIQETEKYVCHQITLLEMIIALLVALGASGSTVGIIIGAYRLKIGGYRYSIEKNGNVKLRKKEDVFIKQFVTHKCIAKSNDGNGKTTIHTGAGGRSYSSGSRKF